MQVNSQLANAIRVALIGGAALSAATTFNTFAAEDTAAAPVERISVTGSRIIREGAVAPGRD
jgi:hypothetical protein